MQAVVVTVSIVYMGKQGTERLRNCVKSHTAGEWWREALVPRAGALTGSIVACVLGLSR